MENFDFNPALPSGVSSMLSAGGILLLSAVIVMVVVIMKRWKGRIMPGILGVVAYCIFVFIFTNLATSALALVPGVDNVFYNNPATYNIVYAIIASVGFTITRIITGYMLKDRFERKGDVYIAGIGISMGDSLLYGLTAISYITWCAAINSGDISSLIADFTTQEAATTLETVTSLFTSPPVLWLLLGISCILDMIINIALFNMVFGAVKDNVSKWWYGITAGIQFFSMISFLLYDSESLASILICFAVKLIIFAATVYYTFKTAGKEIEYSDD